MTPREAAKLLDVTTETLAEWSDKGLLHPRKTIGGHRRYARKEIDKLREDKR